MIDCGGESDPGTWFCSVRMVLFCEDGSVLSEDSSVHLQTSEPYMKVLEVLCLPTVFVTLLTSLTVSLSIKGSYQSNNS